MKRLLVLAVTLALTVLLAVPTAGAFPSDPFLGTWQGVDPADGSFQRLTFGGRGDSRNVVLRDTAGAMCDGEAFVAHGVGTISGTTLWVEFSIRCVADIVPSLSTIPVQYTVQTDGTLEDTWGAPFIRR